MRFQTVSKSAANAGVPEKFRVRQVRALPGTPIAVERLRERLVQAHGHLGLVALHNVLAGMDTSGDGVLDKAELQDGLAKEFGISLSKVDAQHVFGFFDRNEDGRIDIAEFVHGLQGELPPERAKAVHSAFSQRFGEGADGSISPDALREACNLGALTYADVRDAFQHELNTLQHRPSVCLREFEALHRSLSALCPPTAAGDGTFNSIVSQLWG
jgi:Ca2+-binding EF-hand superfamily protein